MTTPCPHCWPPEAQQRAADQATIAALQVENARLARENAALRARVISQHALIKSQRRIRTVLIAALRRQAARLRTLGDV